MTLPPTRSRLNDVANTLRRPGARVALFRALYLGDLLCAVPAVRALKWANPEMHLTLIGLPWAEAFVRRFDAYFDGFIPFPPAPGLHDAGDAAGVEAALRRVADERFDAVLQMHGSGPESNLLVQRMGARHVGGFHPEGTPPSGAGFIPYPSRGSEVERLLHLVEALGIPSAGNNLEFPLTDEDEAKFRRFGLEPEGYVCLHPGAKLASRRWPPDAFARVADHLARSGYPVVISGTEAERSITRAVVAAMVQPPVDLTGATSLGSLAALISHAAFLVANDTGVSHIAAAVRTPSVIVACGSDPDRWAPSDVSMHRLLAWPVDCRPCYHGVCPVGHPCATELSPEVVIAEVQELIDRTMRVAP